MEVSVLNEKWHKLIEFDARIIYAPMMNFGAIGSQIYSLDKQSTHGSLCKVSHKHAINSFFLFYFVLISVTLFSFLNVCCLFLFFLFFSVFCGTAITFTGLGWCPEKLKKRPWPRTCYKMFQVDAVSMPFFKYSARDQIMAGNPPFSWQRLVLFHNWREY